MGLIQFNYVQVVCQKRNYDSHWSNKVYMTMEDLTKNIFKVKKVMTGLAMTNITLAY